MKQIQWVLGYLILFSLSLQPLMAAENEDKPFAEQHIIIQLSEKNASKHTDVLNVASNLMKHYGGPDFVDIQVVVIGRALPFLYKKSPHKERIEMLHANGVRFIACMNTADTIEHNTGKRPELLDIHEPAQVGFAYLLEQRAAGYQVLHP